MKNADTFGKTDHEIVQMMKDAGLVPQYLKTNPAVECLIARRSVRLFTEEPVPDELLEAICLTAQWSCCGGANQGWVFQIVAEPWNVRMIDDAIAQVFGRTPAKHLGGATALILIGHHQSWVTPASLPLDDGCAGQNVLNAAHAYGVDGFWFSQFRNRSFEPPIREALDKIGFPSDCEINAALALGYGVQEEINGSVIHRRKSEILWA